MAATVHRFRSRKQRLTDKQGETARQYVLDLKDKGLSDEQIAPIIAYIDGQTLSQKRWSFVMLSPDQNRAVVSWLRQHSNRPMAAMALWAECFTAIRNDTGEICLTRAELADRVGINNKNTSQIMTELENVGAINRKRDGRRVRYFMNPNVGTHLTGRARDKAQAEVVQLTLV